VEFLSPHNPFKKSIWGHPVPENGSTSTSTKSQIPDDQVDSTDQALEFLGYKVSAAEI